MAQDARDDVMPPVRELAILIPAFATALAIMYDIGYFREFDLRYFSFFSLSEHTVFALQVLPFAIVLSGASIISYFWVLKRHLAQPPRKPSLGEFLVALLLSLVMVVGAGWLMWKMVGAISMIPVLLTGMVMILLLITFGRETSPWIAAIVLGIGSLTTAFWLGRDEAYMIKYQREPTHIVRTGDADIEGMLVRAGDRGLLFQNAATGQVGLIPWDRVKEVVTKEGRPKDWQPPEPWLKRWSRF